MVPDYKHEIIEKLLQVIGIFYLVTGFFSTYAWACKTLDKISPSEKIKDFWNPIAGINGTMNSLNFIMTITLICRGKRQSRSPIDLENKILFFVLCAPLFLATCTFTILEIVIYCMKLPEKDLSLFMPFGEMLFFIGSILLIININFKIWIFIEPKERLLNKFVMLLAFIGMFNYFMFHMTDQQVTNFISVASKYDAYKKYYPNDTSDSQPFHFDEIKPYMQPLVILFCCNCMVYLIKFNFSKKSQINDLVRLIDEASDKSDDSDSDRPIDNDSEINKSNVKRLPSFRLPPLSLVLGILLITVSLLAVAILNSLLKSPTLYFDGQYFSTICSIPIDILSLFLLYMQLVEMKKWPKLKKNENIVDRTLVWIGAIGQIATAISQMEMYSFVNKSNLVVVKNIFYSFLMLQTVMQTLTISLALDREWLPPERKSWQEYICPAVGILSINVSFLIVDIFNLMENILKEQIVKNEITELFLKMFGNGFISLGETLGILQRLHSSLIFIKMIIYTNN